MDVWRNLFFFGEEFLPDDVRCRSVFWIDAVSSTANTMTLSLCYYCIKSVVWCFMHFQCRSSRRGRSNSWSFVDTKAIKSPQTHFRGGGVSSLQKVRERERSTIPTYVEFLRIFSLLSLPSFFLFSPKFLAHSKSRQSNNGNGKSTTMTSVGRG